jgi:hypothetical protein
VVYVLTCLRLQRIKEQDNHGIAVWVKELSGPGRVAVLLVNHGNRVQDFALVFQKHLPDLHGRWARTLHNPPPPPCLDRKPECVGWAASGECERNPGKCVGGCENKIERRSILSVWMEVLHTWVRQCCFQP